MRLIAQPYSFVSTASAQPWISWVSTGSSQSWNFCVSAGSSQSWIWCVSAGSAQHQISVVIDVPTQPPPPTSSSKTTESFGSPAPWLYVLHFAMWMSLRSQSPSLFWDVGPMAPP